MEWSCTRVGRVVYERKPHKFGWKDVLRIVDKLPTPGVWEFKERFIMIQVLSAVLQKSVLDSFFNLFQSFSPKIKDGDVLESLLAGIVKFAAGLAVRSRVED